MDDRWMVWEPEFYPPRPLFIGTHEECDAVAAYLSTNERWVTTNPLDGD